MDSDEEEMKAMRGSARYGGSVRRAGPAAGAAPAADSDEDADERLPLPSSTSAPSRGPPPARKPDSDDEEYMTEEAPAAMKDFFPFAFGKKAAPARPTGPEVHVGQARKGRGEAAGAADRKGGVQFGKRVTDSAASVGATSRAIKAEAKAQQAEEEKAVAASMEVAQQRRMQVEDAESEDELPLPGQEKNALPVSHEVAIQAHARPVTALAFDPKGARMATGSMDGVVQLFDFNGMNEEKQSFRSLEPVDGHMVQGLSFSPTGGCILVLCSDSHARIYDRDGSSKPIQTTVKGDMYVRDMQHTKGHTQMITGGMWHPMAAENWVTSSLDGTIRLWDINATPVGMDQVLPSVHVLKTLDKRGVCIGGASGRTGGMHPTCCAYSGDTKMVVGGCSDGSVQAFFEKQRYMKPDRTLRSAHTAQVTSLDFLRQGTGQLMVTRALDDTVKIWDTRMLNDAKGPLKVLSGLPCEHEKAGVCLSPDGRFLVVGTGVQKTAMGSATVRVYDTKDWSLAKSLDFEKKSPTVLSWQKELNQLVVGTSTGEVTMLYSPFSSKKGALHFVGKKAKKKSSNELGAATDGPIFNMTDSADIKRFYATGHGDMSRIRRAEARQNQKTITPARPLSKDSSQAAPSDTATFATAVVAAGAKQIFLNNKAQEQDSQKALLAYADTEKNTKAYDSLINRAYQKSQPEKVLDWSVDESEGDKRMTSSQKGDFCRKCGQKVCRCFDYTQLPKRQKTG